MQCCSFGMLHQQQHQFSYCIHTSLPHTLQIMHLKDSIELQFMIHLFIHSSSRYIFLPDYLKFSNSSKSLKRPNDTFENGMHACFDALSRRALITACWSDVSCRLLTRRKHDMHLHNLRDTLLGQTKLKRSLGLHLVGQSRVIRKYTLIYTGKIHAWRHNGSHAKRLVYI